MDFNNNSIKMNFPEKLKLGELGNRLTEKDKLKKQQMNDVQNMKMLYSTLQRKKDMQNFKFNQHICRKMSFMTILSKTQHAGKHMMLCFG